MRMRTAILAPPITRCHALAGRRSCTKRDKKQARAWCNTRANRSESKGGWYDISQSVFPLLSPVFELRELKRKQRGNKEM